MHSKRRYRVCISSVILGRLFSKLQGLQYYFTENFKPDVLVEWKAPKQSHCMAGISLQGFFCARNQSAGYFFSEILRPPPSSPQKVKWLASKVGSFENEASCLSTKYPKLENEAPKTRKRSTQNLENEALKTRKRRPLNLENEAPKTRNHCRFNNCNFTSYMTQSESGGGSGCVRTSKGPQNPSQGFME